MNFLSKAARFSWLLFAVIQNPFSPLTNAVAQDNAAASVEERLLRVEINAKSDDETYRLIPCGEKGVLLFYKSVEIVDQDKVKWYFSFYDTDLQVIWSKSIGLPAVLDFKKSSVESDTVAMIFRNNEKAKESEFNFQVVRITLAKGSFSGNTGKLPESAEVADFTCRKGRAFAGINCKNEPAQLMIMDLGTGQKTMTALSPGTVSTSGQMHLDSTGTNIIVSTRRILVKNQTEFVLTRLDNAGKILSETHINSGTPDFDLISMRFLPSGSGGYHVAGTYGVSGAQKGSSKNVLPGESTGFFYSSVHDTAHTPVLFYNFLELKNVGALVGEKDIQSIKKKSAKKNKNLNEYSADLLLLMHPLEKKNDDIILMAESFLPQYHSENFTDYDFYGRPFTNTYSVFDGYRFGKVLITAFDGSGKMLWDNSTDIRGVVSYELSPKVTVYDQDDRMVLIYQSDGKIGSEIIRKNEVVERLDFSPIESTYRNDKLITETKSRLMPWYDNFFLCSGYQEIKNVSLERNNKRLVFYFSKVMFD